MAMEKAKEKVKKSISSSHLRFEPISDLIEKIANEVDIEEKIKWSWGVMKECEILGSSKVAKKHVDKCQSCENFLYSSAVSNLLLYLSVISNCL